MKLFDIAEIKNGFSFRSKVEDDIDGTVSLIQVKDFDEYPIFNAKDDLVKIEKFEKSDNFDIKAGDLIFKSRGSDFCAVLFREDLDNHIFTAPLFRIRVKSKKILPEYLLYLLNNKKTKTYWQKEAKGTSIKLISKEVLRDLSFKLPDLETQKRVSEYFILSFQVKKLEAALLEKRFELSQGILEKV